MKKQVQLKIKHILMLFSGILIIFITVFVAGYGYNNFKNTMIKKIAASRIDVLNQTSQRINKIYESANIIGNFYFYNQVASEFYKKDGFTQGDKQWINVNLNKIDQMARQTAIASDIDYDYILVLDNGYSYATNKEESAYNFERYKNNLYFFELIEKGANDAWISTYKDYNQEGTYVTSIVRVVKNEDQKVIGFSILNLRENDLFNTYKNLIHHNDIYIIDDNGNIVSHKNKNMLSINFYDMEKFNDIFSKDYNQNTNKGFQIITKNGEKFLFTKWYDKKIGWSYIEEIPLNVVLSDVYRLRNKIIIVMSLTILIAVLVIIFISNRITKPLNDLVEDMEKIGHDTEEQHFFQSSGWYEINQICDEFNYMSTRIKNLIEDVKKSERDKSEAQLGFMQAQMSPHFMYNTLFSIKCLVDMGDKEGAIKTVDAFISILKYILSYKGEFVNIAEEIVLLEDYTKLQKVLYGDNFDIDINCDSRLYNAKILRMILQPMVENSLLHGIAADKTKVTVHVNFKLVDDDIKIEVIDDGVGFNHSNLKRLYKTVKKEGESDSKEKKKQSNMIGLSNIRKRIKMIFGDDYGLKIDTEYQKGAKITITLPHID